MDALLNRWTRPCSDRHDGEKSLFQCKKVRIGDCIRAKNIIYSTCDRAQQNQKLSHLMKPEKPVRRRSTANDKTHSFEVRYYVRNFPLFT